MPTAQELKTKEYETIYILRPDVDAESAERVQGRVVEVIGKANGKLTKVESWGRRRLAYPVRKHKRGVFVYLKYLGQGGLVAELERNLKIQDSVLKLQTIMLQADVDATSFEVNDEDVKWTRLELPAETEAEESVERQLGLVEAPERDRDRDRDRDREEESEEYADDDAQPRAAAAPATVEAAAPSDGKKEEGSES